MGLGSGVILVFSGSIFGLGMHPGSILDLSLTVLPWFNIGSILGEYWVYPGSIFMLGLLLVYPCLSVSIFVYLYQ